MIRIRGIIFLVLISFSMGAGSCSILALVFGDIRMPVDQIPGDVEEEESRVELEELEALVCGISVSETKRFLNESSERATHQIVSLPDSITHQPDCSRAPPLGC